MLEIDKEFTEFFSGLAKSIGMNDMQGMVVAHLYLEPEPIAMEELAKETGYSLSSISNTVKLLEGIGIIERVRRPGTKKVYLYLEKNLIRINKRKILAARENMMKPMIELIPRMIEKYEKKDLDEESRKKMAIIKDYHQQIKSFEKALDHMIEALERLEHK